MELELQYIQQPSFLDVMQATGGFLQGVGSVAQGVGSIAVAAGGVAGAVASPVARELMAVPLARGAGRLLGGTARGGAAATSLTARGVSSAYQRLVQMGMPIQGRAEVFRGGVNVADGFGRLMANQHIH